MDLIKKLILTGSILLAGACSTINPVYSKEETRKEIEASEEEMEIDLQGYRTTAKGLENLNKIHEIMYGEFNQRTFRKVCYMVDRYPFGILTEKETTDYLICLQRVSKEQ